VAFEEVARVFFDDGVEVFVCCGERVERAGGEGGVEVWLCVGEYGEENLWWESVEVRHAEVGMRDDLGSSWCCDGRSDREMRFGHLGSQLFVRHLARVCC